MIWLFRAMLRELLNISSVSASYISRFDRVYESALIPMSVVAIPSAFSIQQRFEARRRMGITGAGSMRKSSGLVKIRSDRIWLESESCSLAT